MTKTANAPAEIDLDTATRLRLVVMRLARRLRQQAEPDASPSMLSALAVIERGPLTIGELAEAERVQPPTMTRVVARLEEVGLITRDADPEDKRVARVSLSNEGKKLIARNRSKKNAYLAKRLRATGTEERELAAAVALLESILNED
ncbi:MAG: MarR family transcriptional regulator [Actinobacteria bacterium]|nr:MarR family transcriptional regulator [Actinomycetota bacterium]